MVMVRRALVQKLFAAAAIVLLAGAHSGVRAGDRQPLAGRTGDVVLEVVGQVNNSPAPAPLGSSTQFGYVSFVEGIDQVFATDDPASQNQTTAMLTFVTDVLTTRVTANGPFSIVIREGTTVFYRNTAPADFAVPATFKSGDPIVVSTIRQQVIVDTVEKTFTVTNMNTVTDSAPFEIGGRLVRLARAGDVLRTSLVGVLKARDGVPPPTGFFSGYAVAADRDRAASQ
jgi:hypothetical protein